MKKGENAVKSGKKVTLVGHVSVTDWNGDSTAVELSTLKEDYKIVLNKMGHELLDYVDEEVEVIGYLSNDAEGSRAITVTGFSLVNVFDDEDESWD